MLHFRNYLEIVFTFPKLVRRSQNYKGNWPSAPQQPFVFHSSSLYRPCLPHAHHHPHAYPHAYRQHPHPPTTTMHPIPSPSPNPIAVPIPIATHIPMPITIPMPIGRLPPQCLNTYPPQSPTPSSLCLALLCLAQTSCLAMFAGVGHCPGFLHGQCPSRCTAQWGLHQLRVGFGATAGSAGGAMAGCSCATLSASASGSDLRWERLEDEAFYWGGGKGITHRDAFLTYRLLLMNHIHILFISN